MACVDIPDGLTDVHFRKIREVLEKILSALRTEIKKKAGIRVTSRLNCSATEKAIPVWVGTVEDEIVAKQRRFEAGLVRFGRTNRSKVYEETINDRRWRVHDRDWSKSLSEKKEDGYGPGEAYGPSAGYMHQLFVPIRVKEKNGYRHVGTITVGFKEPPDRDKVDSIMKQWAERGDYLNYLKENFNLGGPVF
jgi:hypothetical protein